MLMSEKILYFLLIFSLFSCIISNVGLKLGALCVSMLKTCRPIKGGTGF